METKLTLQNELVTMLRSKGFILRKELGSGACGKTVLLHDPIIDQLFVCKKYVPYDPKERQSLFDSFVREIKLLLQSNHRNIVRAFTYYVYPEKYAGYIVMEFVDGLEIDAFIKDRPDKLDDIFSQAIEGFAYLEKAGILHRDIRTANLMVTQSGELKIIDLGFGKRISTSADYKKSITLNWAAATPEDFLQGKYDFGTEVYFLGKLFENLLVENAIEQFSSKEVLREMCSPSPEARPKSFAEVQKRLGARHVPEQDFQPADVHTYRTFADEVFVSVSSIDKSAEYITDFDAVQMTLAELYKRTMLEEMIPSADLILNCFIRGSYRFYQRRQVRTRTLGNFLKLLQAASDREKKVIFANLHTRLDRIDRSYAITEEDIPF